MIFRPWMTAGLLLMKILFRPSDKNVLLPLRLSAGMSAAGRVIQNKVFGSGTIEH